MEPYKFVGADVLPHLLTLLRNEMVDFDLATTIDDESTDKYAASARAVYQFVMDTFGDITEIKFEVVTDLPEVGAPGTFYLIRVSQDPPVYEMNVYAAGYWRSIGQAELDLDNYWNKDELVALTIAEVDTIFEGVFGTNTPEPPYGAT